MPATAPFPFWRYYSGNPNTLQIAPNLNSASRPIPDRYYGGALLLLGADGANAGAGSTYNSEGGYTNLIGGDGGSTVEDGYHSYGGKSYVIGGNGGNVSGAGSDSYGGDVQIIGGNAGTTVAGQSYGGDVLIYGGDGVAAGGAYYSTGGAIHISGGAGIDYGGEVTINGGISAGYNGGILLNSGSQIRFQSGDAAGYFVTSRYFHRITERTVAQLPAAGAGNLGCRSTVTDSNAVSFTAGIGAVVAAGGATIVPVFSDGANWRIG